MERNAYPQTPACQRMHTHHVGVGSRWFFCFQLVFFAVLTASLVFFSSAPSFTTLSITFGSIFLEALPFMLFGSLIGGLIEVFVSTDTLARFLPRATLRSIFIAAGAGLVFPVCECAIVPVVRRLFQKGLPLGAGIAFMLGGPIVNPLVAVSTGVAYGYQWSVAIERTVTGYLIAATIGSLIELFFHKRSALSSEVFSDAGNCHCCHVQLPSAFHRKLVLASQHAANDFLDIGRYLVFGAFVAGLLQTVIARGDMVSIAGSHLASVLGMMFLAVALNLCSEADAFIAASFRTVLPYAAQMAFMVLGPMLDIKLVLMYLRIFRKRLIVVLSTLTFLIVFLCMVVKLWSGG